MINIGVMGFGRSGWELHAGPLQTIEGFRVVAIADFTAARLAMAAKTFNVKTYRDPLAMLADADVQMVVVALPNNEHSKYTIAALEAGKDVICEKPMTTTLAEADAMLAAAERSKRRLLVFHNRHWDVDYQMVKQAVRHGLLGDLITVESRIMTHGPEWLTFGVPEFRPLWRIEAAYGGGFLNDWGAHALEQLLDLTGEYPISVVGHLRSGVWATETDDYFDMTLTMASGLLVTVVGTNDARLQLPRWTVLGREGTLMSGSGWAGWTNIHIKKAFAGMTMDMAPQALERSGAERSMEVSDTLSQPFYRNLRDVIEKGAPPDVPVTRARDAIAIMEAVRHSAEKGQAVKPPAPKGSYGKKAAG